MATDAPDRVSDAMRAARDAAEGARRTGTRRRRRRRVLLGAGALVGLWLVAVAVCLVSGARAATDGRDVLDAVRADADARSLLAGEQVPRLREAEGDFATARRWLRNPVVSPLTALPVVGRQVRSARALAGAAESVSGTGADALAEADALLGEGLPSGPARVELLASIADLTARASARLGAVDLGPSSALLAPLADARATAAEELVELRETADRAAAASEGLAALLGGDDHYLLLVANNAEMRAGSGMFLTAGPLDIVDGGFAVGELEQTGDLRQDVGVALEDDDFERLWGWTDPGREWRNLGLSPRFDLTGPLAARMWESARGERVDGVLAVDVLALRALLRATGPITVADTTLDADSVVGFLLYDQYVGYDPTDDADDLERRSRLGEVAEAAVDALERGEVDVAVLAEELAAAAGGRHVLAWSADPTVAEAWRAAGIDGALTPEALALTVANRGANKLDQFLEVEAELEAVPVDAGIEVRVSATLRNTAPADAPSYVLGPGEGVTAEAGTYVGLVSLTMPSVADDWQVSGVEQLAAEGRDGATTVLSASVSIPLGGEIDVDYRFLLPRGHERLDVAPDARATPATWRAGDEAWVADHLVRLGL